MSRETNSILLRYGINCFWSSSLCDDRMSFIQVRLNNLFFFILRNYFLVPIKLHYTPLCIYLYIFYYKEDRFSFIYKFLTLKKLLISVLFYRKSYGFLITVKKNKSRSLALYQNLFRLLIKKIYFKINFFALKKKIFFFSLYNFFFRKKIFFQPLKSKYFRFKKKFKYSMYWFLKIKLINYIVKLKYLSLFLSNLIYLYTNKKYKISLRSILEKPSCLMYLPFKFKYLSTYSLKQKFYIVFLSFFFFKTKILALYLTNIIKKTKNKKHTKNLIIFFSNLKILFEKQFICIYGIKFKIAGRLGGKLRKSLFGYKLGSTQLMTYSMLIDYTCQYIYTPYGSFSIKLWFCNKTDFNFL